MSNKAEQGGSSDAIKKLGEEIKGIRIAMMTTVEEDGMLRSRPMATQEADFDGDLWFFTGAGSPKVDEVEHDRHVNISYSKPDDNRWVSVSGTAQLVRDRAKIDELWKPFLKAWFPKGKDDPELALLRVNVTDAEYWDTQSGAVAHTIGLIKAVATGQQYDPGDHEKLDIK